MIDRVGQQIGNYKLTQVLGRGGFAEVYLGTHIYLKTRIALKLLYGRLTPQDVQSFIQEAQTIAALKHPHIVRVFDFGVEQMMPYIIMDYASSGTMRDRYPSRKVEAISWSPDGSCIASGGGDVEVHIWQAP